MHTQTEVHSGELLASLLRVSRGPLAVRFVEKGFSDTRPRQLTNAQPSSAHEFVIREHG